MRKKPYIINDTNAWLLSAEREHSRGLIPRDFKRHPIGFHPNAKPFDIPLIPEDEWEDRLRARIADKAQLSDVRNRGKFGDVMPSTDQDGYGYCHTADTEVLTEKGWQEWASYNYSDKLATVNPITGEMEFQAPFEKHVYEYNGEIVHSTNRRLDFGVTPDHRMLVRKWDERSRTLSNNYSFCRAADLGWYSGLMSAPNGWLGTELIKIGIPGDRQYSGDDFLAMLALVITDGFASVYPDGTNLVSFASFRPEVIDRVRALAARTGFKEQPSRPGVFNRYGAKALVAWIQEHCYSGSGYRAWNKCIPTLVKCVSERQIEHFLAWNGDQCHTGRVEQYYSTSKRLIDDLQELCLRVGRRGTISKRNPRTQIMPNGQESNCREAWELVISKTDRLSIDRKKHIETDKYNGIVYCAAVPNGTLVTRRNGSILISGNCWAHSSASAILICRAIDNQPYVDLSAFSVAAPIKNYQNQGGWGAESLEWIAEKGIASSEFWPQRACDPKYDTPEMRDNAKLHRFTEWMDLETKEQFITCLLLGMPVVSDFNWWGQSVCTLDLVSIEPFQTRIWNSWGDKWAENGTGILEGNKALPNSMLAARVATASNV